MNWPWRLHRSIKVCELPYNQQYNSSNHAWCCFVESDSIPATEETTSPLVTVSEVHEGKHYSSRLFKELVSLSKLQLLVVILIESRGGLRK